MSTTPDNQFTEILNTVMAWPPDERRLLAEKLLGTLPGNSNVSAKKKGSLKDLLGLIKTDGPPPTDEECDKMREEALRERLGL